MLGAVTGVVAGAGTTAAGVADDIKAFKKSSAACGTADGFVADAGTVAAGVTTGADAAVADTEANWVPPCFVGITD